LKKQRLLKKNLVLINNYFKELEKRYKGKELLEMNNYISSIRKNSNSKLSLFMELLKSDILFFKRNKRIRSLKSNLIKLNKNIPIDSTLESKYKFEACTETYLGFYQSFSFWNINNY
jgi:hypothetical protein